jgi:ribose transport system ATP-binding protein
MRCAKYFTTFNNSITWVRPYRVGTPCAAIAERYVTPLQDANISIGTDEIVGLTRLLDADRSATAHVIFGADPREASEVCSVPMGFCSPTQAICSGIGFWAEDRKADGIIPYLSVRENLTLAALPTLQRVGIVDRGRQQAIIERFIARLGIKTAEPDQPVRELSGGNQQKVLLARRMCLNPKLLLERGLVMA